MMRFDPFKRQPVQEIEYAFQVTVTLGNGEQVVHDCTTQIYNQFMDKIREAQTAIENLYELRPRLPEVTEF